MIMERRIALSVLCDLNNGAVDLLATGRCDLAQIVFAEAIQATTKLMRKETNEQTEGCALDSSDNAETLPNSAQLFQSSVLNICHDETLSDGGHEQSLAASEDGGFVYRRAFKLRYDHYMPQFETICIIILYNMVRTASWRLNYNSTTLLHLSLTLFAVVLPPGYRMPYTWHSELLAPSIDAGSQLLRSSSVSMWR